MLDCERVRNCISDYSVGGMSKKEAALLEAHIASCADCAKELRILEGTLQMVEAMPQADPPAGMWSVVYERITAEDTSRGLSFGERVRAMFFPPARALAAGFAVLVLLIALTFSNITNITSPAPAVTADASTSEYVQGHAFFASQDAFADRYSLASVAGAAMPADETPIQ